MNTSHTPGPWTTSRMHLGPNVKDRRSGFVVNGPDADPLPVRICDIRCAPEAPFHVSEANARLIAAAPDLLDALKALLPFIEMGFAAEDNPYRVHHNDATDALSAAETAITKATQPQ